MAAKAGRFYEIRKQVGDKPYELTEDIQITPMDLDRREAWRKASYGQESEPYLQAIALANGTEREIVDHSGAIAQALLGDQYDAVKALCASDARLWDAVLDDVRGFNKLTTTTAQVTPASADAEGNDSATPA
ncbi:uncharacterized protein RMCFA_3588 [Mycolicibacterium fortuitum subsp. acetamidolyticum]|uniref:Tail assembly chaperone n=1 Tax=Mycolicibacterium fortuitum subsp. acetamidolyticum TaxID=144550 RepID=A0A117IF01_MYCFO|nr:hypothetical protein [Mycolicibacterium fortuitum]MCV7139807.1 hypothetical protein [Mycolicibacterium fortuitum]GAT03476.1 uncharacterized protein RMCFA_3588 [Mycolicibacterium fortuitum subsp. acetamidolyticum]